ncbi:hypothetical protein QUB08_02400 [Microcoleus sp. BR0-C5]|uniref:hypothetical protein n=1 Tax=Microcoleus sp. BR0-C5 TaxID=2818713 RepID=UPI002FD3967F
MGVAGTGAIDIAKQRLPAMYALPRVEPDEPGWYEELAQQQIERISSKVARLGREM